MDNVKLTLPGGLKVEAGYMTVAEAKDFDAKVAVPDSTVATLAEAVGILAKENKILAIRLARAVMGTGLREAKTFMETHHAARLDQERRWAQAQAWADAESERLRQRDRENVAMEERERQEET